MAMGMELFSSAFGPGSPIPRRYTGEGEDLSPPLQWKGVPEGTQELALICDDPDAPTPEPWVHWVIYKIPPNATGLPEGLPKTAQLSQPPGAMQGKNSWTSGPTIGYRGPMPPPGHGVHHYHFTLYALDSPLNVQPGETKKNLLKKMEGHILATATLIGTYQR
jgi:Raf kinase inhibitor-like YbhB/YbcL family protein